MKLKMDDGKVLTLKLVEDYEGCVDVVVKKVDGKEASGGILFSIFGDGTFSRIGDVNPELGFSLNSSNKIKENK